MAYKYEMKDITMSFVDYIYHRKNYNKAIDRKKSNLCL